jgi:small subunit ribosomal protein S4
MEESKAIPMVAEGQASPERDIPEYIEVDEKKMKATYLRVPKLEEVPYPVQIEPNLIVEFYSR